MAAVLACERETPGVGGKSSWTIVLARLAVPDFDRAIGSRRSQKILGNVHDCLAEVRIVTTAADGPEEIGHVSHRAVSVECPPASRPTRVEPARQRVPSWQGPGARVIPRLSRWPATPARHGRIAADLADDSRRVPEFHAPAATGQWEKVAVN